MTLTPLFKLFCGRTTFVMLTLLVVGVVLAFMGKLTTEFVAFGTMLHMMTVAHSAKEDWFIKQPGSQTITDK